MYFTAQGFCHCCASDIGDGMKSKAIPEFIVDDKIFANAIHYQVEELMFLMEEQRHSQVANLFLGEGVGGDKIDSL